jgi:hypothetical protein
MKTITFDHINIEQTQANAPRSQREDLIEQIVAQCTFRKPGEDRKLARLLAVTANTARWSTTDLHALLKKRQDPTIRSYTRFVWWSAKIKKKTNEAKA